MRPPSLLKFYFKHFNLIFVFNMLKSNIRTSGKAKLKPKNDK